MCNRAAHTNPECFVETQGSVLHSVGGLEVMEREVLPEKEGFLREGTFGLGFYASVGVFKAQVGSMSILQAREPDVFTRFKDWQAIPVLPRR